MKVIEFYLKENIPEQTFEKLIDTFYKMPNPIIRRVDGETGSAVFSISRNPKTGWVQLLIDEDTPSGQLNAIRSRAKGLSDKPQIGEYESLEGMVKGQKVYAPTERPRLEMIAS